MPKKGKNGKNADSVGGLWIAPSYTLKGPRGERAWENRVGGIPHSSRFLELADIALGLKKPPSKKKRVLKTHQKNKKEPYSQE